MSDRPAVVTRFAPSPTGYLHIGGARTALFNWLYARHCGGTFLLRIEDTDRERSTEPAVAAILHGLDWLGLKADAEPVFQFARADRHRQAVMDLVAKGRAYRCFMTAEEADAQREQARGHGQALRSPWRDRTPGPEMDNQPFVVRFRGPTDGDTVVEDLVQGTVTFHNRDLDDLVLLRTDGAPTYNLAVVVDDHDMGITHVIRGDDHLNNAARQSLIYEALNFAKPAFGHIPLIHGPDGAKLSKRHGAQAVGDYADQGYLPETLRNYLARLGWSHGNDEIFSDAEAIRWFDIADVNKGASRLDWDKLAHLNAHYIKAAEPGRISDLVLAALTARGQVLSPETEARLRRAIPILQDRGKTILELADQLAFVIAQRPMTLDDKTQKQLTPETVERLRRLQGLLKSAPIWEAANLEGLLKDFAESETVGFGRFGPALRGILTGGSPAPDLGRTLAALTREESLSRMDDSLSLTH
jgi:glutamyl-tRNA synthetase